MAESIIISLGRGLRHLGHLGHFDHLLHFNFFDCSADVSDLGDNSSDGSSNDKSDDSGCKWCKSEERVNNCDLILKPSISSSNFTIDWWCFETMMRFEIKKKKCKSAGERTVNSQQR